MGAPRPVVPERQRARAGWLAIFGGNRLIIAVSALAVLAAMGLLLFAWWDQNVRPRTKTAIEVGGRSYDMDYWARRFKMTYDDPANANDVRAADGFTTRLPERTSDAITREAVLLQRAGSLGVSAGSNEIDTEMMIRLNVPVVSDTPEGQQPSPDDPLRITPGAENAVRAELRRTGFTLAQYREMTEGQLLRKKAEEQYIEQQPTRGPQAKIRVLQFPNESDSRIAIQKIKNGEARFDELAESVSLDQLGKGKGGLRDFLPHGILPKPLDDAAFSLPLNTLSEPIDSGLNNGWFLIEVIERVDERDISDDARKQLAQSAFNDWFNQQKEELGAKNNVTAEDIAWADGFVNIRASAAAASLPGGAGVPGQGQTIPAVPGAIPAAPGAAPAAAPAPAPAAAPPPPPPPASSP